MGLMPYAEAWAMQARLVEARQRDEIPDTLVLLQHPHTYTFGRRATSDHLLLDEEELRQKGIATFWVDRGGDVTYHGPGQIVGYPIIDLRAQRLDVHRYLRSLEEVLIQALTRFGIQGERDPAYTGVWVSSSCHCQRGDESARPHGGATEVENPGRGGHEQRSIRGWAGGPTNPGKGAFSPESGTGEAAKIAAIGVKIGRGVTSHGFALNVNTDLSYFDGIVPCGITGRRVTSMEQELGWRVEIEAVEGAVEEAFRRMFSAPGCSRNAGHRQTN